MQPVLYNIRTHKTYCCGMHNACHLNILTDTIGYIHWTICKQMGLQVPDKNYENIPERVTNVNSSTFM